MWSFGENHPHYYRLRYGDTTVTRVFVGGLAEETPTKKLRQYFEKFGEIHEVVIITEKNTGRSQSYGFVKFCDPKSAWQAIRDPNPRIHGRRTNCYIAMPGSLGPLTQREGNQGAESSYFAPPRSMTPLYDVVLAQMPQVVDPTPYRVTYASHSDYQQMASGIEPLDISITEVFGQSNKKGITISRSGVTVDEVAPHIVLSPPSPQASQQSVPPPPQLQSSPQPPAGSPYFLSPGAIQSFFVPFYLRPSLVVPSTYPYPPYPNPYPPYPYPYHPYPYPYPYPYHSYQVPPYYTPHAHPYQAEPSTTVEYGAEQERPTQAGPSQAVPPKDKWHYTEFEGDTSSGSIPHTKHRRRLKRVLGKYSKPLELHTRTHQQHTNQWWGDERSEKDHDDCLHFRESQPLSGEGSSSGSTHSSDYQALSQAIGGKQKGKVHELNSQSPIYDSYATTSTTCSHWSSEHDVKSQREAILTEEMEATRQIHAREMNEMKKMKKMQATMIQRMNKFIGVSHKKGKHKQLELDPKDGSKKSDDEE